MSKHDLRARPVFHHTRDAIEAHLTVVMASLAVARYLQDATGISIARIVRELRGLQEVSINLNGHQITAQPQLTQTAAEILKSLQTRRTLRRQESGLTASRRTSAEKRTMTRTLSLSMGTTTQAGLSWSAR